MTLTFEDFERRVQAEPDLELGWVYWNVWLPETSLLWIYVFLHQLNRSSLPVGRSRGDHE